MNRGFRHGHDLLWKKGPSRFHDQSVSLCRHCPSWQTRAVQAAESLPDDPAALFQQTLAATRMPVALRDGRLSGPGATFLEARANESQFVLVGEEHGVADIASTVRALLAGIGPLGYRHLAIESALHRRGRDAAGRHRRRSGERVSAGAGAGMAARAKGSLEFLGTVELRELQELHALLGGDGRTGQSNGRTWRPRCAR
ncbi:MAG: hypothetical protein KIT37_12110 [Steroidobacteraceae bacterium]|nr:hypothetical protein [Steroidobacteraceae bacterium]